MICRANGTSRGAVTWDAAARRARNMPGRVTRPAGLAWAAGAVAGLQAAGIGRRALVPGRPGPPGRGWPRASRENGPGSGVDWVTMSDSCHTERTRIGETPGNRPGAAARAARTPAPAGFSGIMSRRLGDHHRPGPE